jgi:hypothetical protein
MPTLNFTIKNTKNSGLVINTKELLAFYFHGINLESRQGTTLDESTIEFYIVAAQQEIEKFLTIKLIKELIYEVSDYYRNEFNNKGFVKTIYTVNTPVSLVGMLGNQEQIRYPTQWLTSNSIQGEGKNRQIIVVPNSNLADLVLGAAVYGGTIIPYLGLINSFQIASYFHKEYTTGFDCDDVPQDIISLIGKLAAIPIFNILGDIVLGIAGLSGSTVTIDGLSQEINTTASATNAAFGARIINYTKEINESLSRLTGVYKGITFTAI